VMKAGGAFLILDPAYPAVRNVECLRQARPKALLQIEGASLPAALEAFAGELPSRVRLPEDPRAGGPWVEGAPDADVEPGDDDVA
jgi:non-ribosomal peptide synthetase component F